MKQTAPRTLCDYRIGRLSAGVLIAALSMSTAFAEPGAEVALVWAPPTNNLDGTMPANLAGYRLHFGASGAGRTNVVDVGDTTSVIVRGLAWGTTYRFVACAYAASGEESPFSNEATWTSPESPGDGSGLAALDFDGDGQSDAWEILHFGTTGAPHGAPHVDHDGDGKTNVEEFIAGTDPNDADSVPALTIAHEGLTLVVSFAAPGTDTPEYRGLNRRVTLESAPDPLAGPWTPMPGYDSVPASNQVITSTFSATPEPRYFRAAIRIE
jgi:hypothetical protein